MKIKVGVSARHIHLSKEDFDLLFGQNTKLIKLKDLSQDNNFSCIQTVDLINQDKKINNVRIIGPVRSETQVEISKTDAYVLKINPPCKNSGDLKDALEINIKGPNGAITRRACIIANRHIHMNEKCAKYFNYNNDDIVKVRLFGEKGGIIDNVHIKISNCIESELHLDLDDANAHMIQTGDMAEILREE